MSSRSRRRDRRPRSARPARPALLEGLESRTFLSATLSPPVAPFINAIYRLQGATGVPNSLMTHVEWTENSANASGVHIDLYNTAPDLPGAAPIDSISFPAGTTRANLPNGGYVVLYAYNADGRSPLDVATTDDLVWQDTPLAGTPIGTPGSWNNSGNDLTKALDNDPSTFFDSPASQGWLGYDLGKPYSLSAFSFVPRVNFADRMIGGQFQGSDDGASWNTLATISGQPADGQYTTLGASSPRAYRYVRYLSPDGGWGNIAEFRVLGTPASFLYPATPASFRGVANGTHIALTWSENSTSDTHFTLNVYADPDYMNRLQTQALPAGTTSASFDAPGLGRYYFALQAFNATGSSSLAETDNLVPTPPSSVSAALAPAGVSLAWTDTTNIEGNFSIYRSVNGSPFSLLTTLQPSGMPALPAKSYLDATATAPGSTYSYYVTGIVTPDMSPPSSTVSVTVPGSANSHLTGTPIGTPGSWNNSGNDFTKALDGDPTTYFDAPTSQAFVGYDFGSATLVTSVNWTPRAGYAWRMVGGTIRGSNDGTTWTTLYTISATGDGSNTVSLPNPAPYRYVEYLSPDGGYGNIAELNFYGPGSVTMPFIPAAPSNITATPSYLGIFVTWTDNASNESGYTLQLSTSPDFTSGITTVKIPVNTTNHTFGYLPAGTYYFRVAAFNSSGTSAYSTYGPISYSAPAAVQVTGTPIGTPGSWNSTGNDLSKALDGDLTTFFDAPTPQAYVGYDFGSPGVALAYVKVAPRPGVAWRMVGGRIEGSNDGTTWITMASITSAPPDGTLTTIPINNPRGYRYIRYLSADQGYGNVAEVQFFGTLLTPATQHPVSELSGTGFGSPGSWNNSGNTFAKALDGNLQSFFDAPTPDGNYVGLDPATPHQITSAWLYPRSTYEYRMTGGQIQASNDMSTWTTLATVTSQPAYGQVLQLASSDTTTAYRYVRYLSPDNSYGNVADVIFWGRST